MADVTAGSRYERLIDRWIDLTRWPTAKKTAFAMSAALVFHVTVPLIALQCFRLAPGLVDTRMLTTHFTAWAAALVVLLAVSLVCVWQGREGRWTVYLMIFVYGWFLAEVIRLFGLATSPASAVAWLVVLLVLIFFDLRAGLTALAVALAGTVAIMEMELSEVVPYAPVILLRTFDAQRALGWYLYTYITIFGVFTFVFLLLQLMVSVRETQQQRLEAAHQALGRANAKLARGTDLIRRYVPAQLAEQLLSGEPEVHRSHQRLTLTVFFSDIEGFTALVDQIEPEDASRLLNEYFSEMATIAERFGGTVDKFVGDAVMVLFGAPGPAHTREHAVRAVEMALAMQARTAELAGTWLDVGLQAPLRVRMGINTGPASVGNFGSAGRMDFTAIGNQVNLAARVQSHCPPGSVLITHSTWALVKDRIACAPAGDMTVKGIHYPVRVYEVRSAQASSRLEA